VIVLPAGNPSQWTGPTGNNTYLFTGKTTLLIDAGVGNAAHLQAIEAAVGGSELKVILLTHSHSDHASGVPALRGRWPGAVVRALADGDVIPAGDGTLVALHTPGHAPDHFCFRDESTGDIFCGDLIRLGGTIVIPANKGGDLRAYLASLERVRNLRPPRLWPGHGPVIDEPLRLIDEYIEHRKLREAQIVEALRRGRATPSEIVPDVYPALPSTLTAAAADSVLAHLRKLEQDGLAEERGQRWLLR
jgi:glyoxylase-like metal-dependent hydrolase (beta-lactamase superfamily II)